MTSIAVSPGFTLAEANVHKASALPMAPELVPSHVCFDHSTLQSGDGCDWNLRPKQQNAQLTVDRAEDVQLRVMRQVQHLSVAAICVLFAAVPTEKSSHQQYQHCVT